MSYANGTPFLNLPQTVGDDKRDWFDTNEAFLNLDAKVKSAYEGEIGTAAALSALAEVVSGISSDVEALQGTVGEHTTSIGTINEALILINSTLVSLNASVSGKFDSAGIADPYDAEHGTYSVGDVVTYNGQRYECITAVTAAEPFDADKWNAVDIQTKLDQIDTSLSNKCVSVSADGIKTYGQILTELKAGLGSNTLNSNSRIEIRGSNYCSVFNCADTVLGIFTAAKALTIATLNFNTLSWSVLSFTDTPTITEADLTSVAPTNVVISLYFG